MKAFQYTEIRQIVEDFGLRIPKLPVKMLVGRDDVRKIVRHEDLVMLEIDHPSSIVLKGGLYNGEEFFEFYFGKLSQEINRYRLFYDFSINIALV